jgi:protease PrsW
MYGLLLVALSVAPAFAFLVLILRMDRAEPEPLREVLRIVGLGGAAALAAALLEMALDGLPFFQGTGLAGAAAASFLQVAPVEELAKLGVVLLFAWGRPSFNEENDGVVYVGASAIGFAVLENITYVASNGFGTGVLRAFTAMPLHVFTAVVMGLFVGKAKFAVGRYAQGSLVACGFLAAWAFHGAYDTLAFSGGALMLLLLPLLGGLAALGIVSLRRGRVLSLLRWTGAAAEPGPVVRPAGAKGHRWMPILSRCLLALCILFWVLLAVGSAGEAGGFGETAVGGVLITVLPLGVAVVTEAAWQRRRRRRTGK